MIVALNITSESADSYLLLFKDETVEEIKNELYEGGESYYGASVKVEVLDASSEELAQLSTMLTTFREDSWNFC